MSITLVTHDTALPALDAMMAGLIAAETGAVLMPLETGGGGLGAYEARQHVLASGALAANGLFWGEWAGAGFTPPAAAPQVIAGHAARRIVVPVNPAVAAEAEMAQRLRAHAGRRGRAPGEVRVLAAETAGAWRLDGDLPEGFPRLWHRDRWGRPAAGAADEGSGGGEGRVLLIVGSETRLRDTYPAVLAALGDAAEAAELSLHLRFWDPAFAGEEGLPDLDGVAGVLLPGGADMEQVAGQIGVAREAISLDLPLLGLCLGMQTLTTATAQLLAGFNDANMEEAAPDAATMVFRRLSGNEVAGAYRLGLQPLRPEAGSRLAKALAGGEGPQSEGIHCNHRYVLDPALEPRLERAGLRLSARQPGNDLADAAELPGLRFCMGLQGHPELLTRRTAPHPLFTAFLAALLPG